VGWFFILVEGGGRVCFGGLFRVGGGWGVGD